MNKGLEAGSAEGSERKAPFEMSKGHWHDTQPRCCSEHRAVLVV